MVVLPTPPFWFATAMIRGLPAGSGAGGAPVSSAAAPFDIADPQYPRLGRRLAGDDVRPEIPPAAGVVQLAPVAASLREYTICMGLQHRENKT